MKLKILIGCIFICIQFSVHDCKPLAGSTKEQIEVTTGSPDGKTPPPWLKFLKNKKTTIDPATTESSKGSRSGSKGVNSVRALPPPPAQPQATPSPSEMQELANWLGIYLQPSGDIMAQDRKENPDTLYDAIYLDWMKRRDLGGSDESSVAGDASYLPPADPPLLPAPQPIYGYPAMPAALPFPAYPAFPFGPYFPSLAGLKMQKMMAQAQVDAAMAALNITTTPKPLKLKLKITVPGNVGVTELGKITTGLSNSLPVGSTYSLE